MNIPIYIKSATSKENARKRLFEHCAFFENGVERLSERGEEILRWVEENMV